ncbi:arylsulfatase [Sphingobium xanthum]|uniref:arylsulfatase n=1 Tax=Sphingobium xanthum TaxID=1387165 RepID=UPI001C8C921A|nr:arylsulfatase [Sphingobium xanthum]
MSISRRAFIVSLCATTALATGFAATRAQAAARRPNIITIILDDVGYSDLGCFGAEIRTPAMDALAGAGLRYAHFHTKAVCSSTRAALLTGRNSHSVNMPDVPDVVQIMKNDPALADMFDIPSNAQNLAQALKRRGYATWAVGKWHLTPMKELGANAGRTSWPRQRGFDYFYGFARGWTDQYQPDLVENDQYIKPELPEGYHLSVDLTDRALALIERHQAAPEAGPFYLNLAYGTAHAPIQVSRDFSAPYDAIYEKGWDAVRESRFERMKAMGIVPPETVLPTRAGTDRAWADLDADEKAVFTRYMAVYAGFIEHCDRQIGRLIDGLKRGGLYDDTIIVLLSDNGAAGEAGQEGEFDGLYRRNTLTPAQQRARIEELGTGKTQAEYPRPWAMVGSTPFRRYKLWPYSGGTRTPMIFSWPREVRDPGAIRRQFVDVIDVAPTLLDAAGAAFDAQVDGVKQLPIAGRSFLATVRDGRVEGRHTQYFELRGNRAITDGQWRAVAMQACGQDHAADRWELYDLASDFSESTDVASRHPTELQRLKALWQSEWASFVTTPLGAPLAFVCERPAMFDLAPAAKR